MFGFSGAEGAGKIGEIGEGGVTTWQVGGDKWQTTVQVFDNVPFKQSHNLVCFNTSVS